MIVTQQVEAVPRKVIGQSDVIGLRLAIARRQDDQRASRRQRLSVIMIDRHLVSLLGTAVDEFAEHGTLPLTSGGTSRRGQIPCDEMFDPRASGGVVDESHADVKNHGARTGVWRHALPRLIRDLSPNDFADQFTVTAIYRASRPV